MTKILYTAHGTATRGGRNGGEARKQGKKLPEGASVHADVSFADREDNVGFTIVPVLTATVPGWSRAEIEETMKLAHDFCPYSNLFRFALDVELMAAQYAAYDTAGGVSPASLSRGCNADRAVVPT